MATEPPPFFFEHSTITQVLSCTLHMLRTVTYIAAGVLIGLEEPVLNREAKYTICSLSRDEVECIARKACYSVCKRGEIKIKRGRYFKIEWGERDTEKVVLLCVCRSVSLCDETHAGCLVGKFIRKKFVVFVVYAGFVIFLYMYVCKVRENCLLLLNQ